MSTESQAKLRRAEQARRNGAKSKGPKTEAGKARAAMNALKHATYADVNRSWLPVDAGILSNESRELAFRIFDGYCRQLQPQSEVEILLVKQLTGHQCHLDRLLKIEAALLQTHLDQITPNVIAQSQYLQLETPNSLCTAQAYVRAVHADEKVLRALDRQRRSHERGIQECLRRLKELRQSFAPPVPETLEPEVFRPLFGLAPNSEPNSEPTSEPNSEPNSEPCPEAGADKQAERQVGKQSEATGKPRRAPIAERQTHQPLSNPAKPAVGGTNRPKAA